MPNFRIALDPLMVLGTDKKKEKIPLRASAAPFESQKTEGLSATAPLFVSQYRAQHTEGLRTDAPLFVSQRTEGLRADAPEFVPNFVPEQISKEPKIESQRRNSKVVRIQVPPKDSEELGEVLFRRSSSATEAPWANQELLNNSKSDYDLWAEEDQAKTQSHWSKAKSVEKTAQKAANQSKWQPKERTFWKSSHVVEALRFARAC